MVDEGTGDNYYLHKTTRKALNKHNRILLIKTPSELELRLKSKSENKTSSETDSYTSASI